MNNLEKITNVKSYISTATVPQALAGINAIINSYKEYKIAEAMESTKRAAIREEARVQICALQEATKQKKFDTEQRVMIANRYIDILNKILNERDILDDVMTNICIELIHGAMNW